MSFLLTWSAKSRQVFDQPLHFISRAFHEADSQKTLSQATFVLEGPRIPSFWRSNVIINWTAGLKKYEQP
jgi:hypothetical protein